jgi:hypothetical protein
LAATITLLLFCVLAQGQQTNILSNLRTKKIAAKPAMQAIDTVSIVPNTFIIAGIASTNYKLDEVNAQLTWLQTPPFDSVTITYRVFPYKLNASLQRMNYFDVMNNFVTKPITFEGEGFGKGLFDFGNVNYNGSFGRGISFGNNQDAVVNGVLNMQINGMIGDSMMLSAALTDNNIPVQAEGNTQQLNEFDQVWIQLKKKGWQLNLGDIDVRRNDAYFLNFFKRLQGAAFQTENKVFKTGNNKALVSGAIAKGKFNRYIFQGQEGNQGPYRLQGPNGELFFIVLAGTERVFIDGELMQRGEDQDYMINYNTAEITFTPRRMINKDRRIQVEFEYNDRNFLNSQFIIGDDLIINKNLSFHINGFSNADSRNSSLTQQLDPQQKQFLANAGDVPNGALYPAIVLDTFAANRIVYRKLDTIVNAVIYTNVLVYTPVPLTDVYSAVFTEVGQGNGDYIQVAAGANGRTFQWIAPVNGIKQGRFEPVVRLIAPRTQQMATFGTRYQLSSKLALNSEIAISRFDVNTLSSKDKDDDLGWAGRMVLTYTDQFSKKKNALGYKLNAGYEYVQEKFRALERLRPVEFTREWGLPIFLQQQEERILNTGFELFRNKENRMSYTLQTYKRGENFKGIRHITEHFIQQKGWTWNARMNYSVIDSNTSNGFFLRPLVELKKKMKFLKETELGGSYYLEHNENRNKVSDSLAFTSFSWDTWTLFLRSPENANKWGVNFFTRRDQLPIAKAFEQVDRSFNYNAYWELMSNEHHQFRFNATLRQLKVYNSNLTNLKPERTLLSRVEYFINEWKGLVQGNILYEVGSGQEQRRDFSFLEVPAGQGEYTWNDYNSDGVPQLNEFEIAQFRDQARYIRVFTPTLDFIRANYNQFNYSLSVNPKAAIDINKAKAFAKFITRISTQSSMQIFKKEISDKDFSLDPFGKPKTDTSLISLTSIISNTFFFNRTSTVWGYDVTHLRSVNRSILTYGLETRTLREVNNRLRWNLNKKFAATFNLRLIKNQLETPTFGNRNYNLDHIVTEPLISYQQGTKYRFSLSYKYENKNNTEGLKERATINSMILDARYNVLSSSTLNGKFQFSNIAFTGQTNTTVAFIMLDALLPGKNFLWNFDFTKRLANNMEINFQYEGRKPGTGRTIHTGRAGVRALF